MTCAHILKVSKSQALFSLCMFVIALEIFVSSLSFHIPDFCMKELLAQIPSCSASPYDCFLNCFFVFKSLYYDKLVKIRPN